MYTFPTPDDGLGVIGDILTFTFAGYQWRAFEYKCPVTPAVPKLLVLFSDNERYERQVYHPDWRHMSAEELITAMRG